MRKQCIPGTLSPPPPHLGMRLDCWYDCKPVGHRNTVHRLCRKAEIPGYKTIPSLRVSAVTRLFQKDVDEQLIMSVTGHCSVDGVRAYKRVSDNQKQQLSKYLWAKTCNKENIHDVENEPVTSVKPSLPSVVQPVMQLQSSAVQQPIVP